MIKTALNALKARQLADKAGIIAEPKSQWKWALRQLRKPNPSGSKTDDLVLSGRKLDEARQGRIGLISNNERQQISALQRKQKLGIEVGRHTDGTMVVGERGTIANPGRLLKSHTHPKNSIFSGGIDKKNPEYTRRLDKTLIASPSGQNWKNTQRLVNKNLDELKKLPSLDKKEIKGLHRKVSDLEGAEFTLRRSLLDISDAREYNKYLLSLKKHIPKSDINASRREVIQSEWDHRKLVNKLKKSHPKSLKNLSPYKEFNKDKVDYSVYKNKLMEGERRRRLAEDLEYAVGSIGDTSYFANFPKRNHNILADNITGVHQWRGHKLPRGTRSVYFKKGLDT